MADTLIFDAPIRMDLAKRQLALLESEVEKARAPIDVAYSIQVGQARGAPDRRLLNEKCSVAFGHLNKAQRHLGTLAVLGGRETMRAMEQMEPTIAGRATDVYGRMVSMGESNIGRANMRYRTACFGNPEELRVLREEFRRPVPLVREEAAPIMPASNEDKARMMEAMLQSERKPRRRR
jgi:hypothetical protein